MRILLFISSVFLAGVLYAQDDCTNAVNLPFGDYSTCGRLAMQSIDLGTASHSGSTPSPTCANFGGSTEDLWYTVTVPAGVNTLAFHMFNSNYTPFFTSASKPGMAVYRGTGCTSLSLLDCFETNPGFMENGEIRFEPISGLIPGETLYIRVWDEGNIAQQIFLIVSEIQSLPEDNCATPVQLGTGGCNILSTGGDVAAPEDCGWNTTDNSIFYYFTVAAGDPQPYTITAENGECWANSGGEDPEIQFAVYSWNGSNCNGIGGSGSSYQGCANGTGVVTFSENLAPGNYILAFDGYSMMSGNSLCIFGFEAPFITPELTVTLNTTNAICGSGGSASITVLESCTGNPTISWSNSASGFTVQNLAAGNYTVTVNDGIECGDTVINFTISSTGALTVEADITGDPCEGSISASATVTGADPSLCNYAWSTTPPQYTQTVNNLAAGTYTVTATLGSCNDTDQVTVVIYDNISVNGLATQCNTTNTEFTLTFNVTGSTGNPASFNANWGSGNQPFTGSFSHNFTSPSTYNITVTDNNGCDEIVLTGNVDCGCETNAGTMTSLQPIQLCSGECTTGVAHNGDQNLDGDDIFEYIIHTGGFPAVILGRGPDPVFCLNDIAGGGQYETVYYISAVAGNPSFGHVDQTDPCYSQAVGTPVIWHQTPIAYINGNELETCGNTIHLSAMAAPMGMNAYWTANAQFVPMGGSLISSPEINVLVNTYADITFYWNVDNGPCTARDSILVHFNQTPNPFAGNDTIVCGNSVILNAALSLPASIGQWSGNGATFTVPSDPHTEVQVYNFGTYVFTWTESNGSCFDQDSVTITFLQEPTPNTTLNHDTVCGVTYNLNVLNVMNPGQWRAYDDGIQIFPNFINGTNNTNPTATVVVPNYSSLYNTISFVWTEVNMNSGIQCFGSASVEVTFAREPSASVGQDDQEQVCGNVFTLAADTIGSGWAFGTWVVTNVIAAFDDINSPNATITIDSLGSFGDSAHVVVPVIWVMNNSGCTAMDTMFLTFYNAPDANAGINDSICGFEYTLHSYYSIPATSGYTPTGWWSFHSGPGVASIFDQNSTVTNVTVSTEGIYRFVWRESNSILPSCYSTDTVSIKFIEKPIIYAGDNFNVCGQCSSLSCISSGYPGNWQPVPGVTWGNVADPLTSICSQQYGPIEFIWQESNNVCTNRDTVVVTFWRRPTAEILTDEADSTQCGLCFTRLQAGIPGQGIVGTWRDLNEPSATFTAFNQVSPDTVCVTQYGIHNFIWVEETGVESEPAGFCTDTAGPLPIRFIRVPEANAGPDTTFCGYTGYLNAVPSYGTGTWTTPSTVNIQFENAHDPETFIESNVLNPTPTNPNFLLVWTENNTNNCTDKDTMYVIFARIPIGDYEIKPPKCFGEYATLIALDDTLSTYNWQFFGDHTDSISDINSAGGDYRHTVEWNNTDTAHFVSLTTTNWWGCESPLYRDTIYEPAIPEYGFEVFPDTCLLGKGAVLFTQDVIASSFEWLDTEGTGITPTHIYDQEQYNIPTGSYRVAAVYTTFNMAYYSFYLTNFGTAYCYDTITIDIEPVGLIDAAFEVAADININDLVAPNADVWFVNLTDYDDVRTKCVWHFGDGETVTRCDEQVEHIYTEAGCYEPYLVVMNRDLPECRDTARLEYCIPVDEESLLEIPNIFSPNGDGTNDFFQVKAQTLMEFRGVIVNRWGRTVFEWTNWQDMEAGWDGKLSSGSDAAPGVYFYIITAKGIDEKVYEFQGPLHLMREN